MAELMRIGPSVVSGQGASRVDGRGVRIHTSALLQGGSVPEQREQLGEVCLFIGHGARRYLQPDGWNEAISSHGCPQRPTAGGSRSKIRVTHREYRSLLRDPDRLLLIPPVPRDTERPAPQHTLAGGFERELTGVHATDPAKLADLKAGGR
jgi:hypothetical protein